MDEVAAEALILSFSGDTAVFIHTLSDFKDISHAELFYSLEERFGACTLADDKRQL